MFSLAKILLPVDFSDRSKNAAQYAIQLAERFGSEITILHVLPPVVAPPHEYPEIYVGVMSPEVLEERRAQARHHLDGFLESEFRHLRAYRIVEEGDPATYIIQHAQAGNFGLIMMPTHGYGPFRQFLLGSVTAKVLHGADCPVWTGVHVETGPPTASVDLNHIVCAVDLGPHSAAVLDWGSRMAAEFKARLSLVHVAGLDPRTEAYYFSPEWRKQIIQGARARIDQLQTDVGVDAEVHLEIGDVHNAVRAATESLKGDLLIVGRGSRSGISGRLPSTAYAIIRDSPCPVVSV